MRGILKTLWDKTWARPLLNAMLPDWWIKEEGVVCLGRWGRLVHLVRNRIAPVLEFIVPKTAFSRFSCQFQPTEAKRDCIDQRKLATWRNLKTPHTQWADPGGEPLDGSFKQSLWAVQVWIGDESVNGSGESLAKYAPGPGLKLQRPRLPGEWSQSC